MERDVIAIVGAIVATIVVFTLLTGGSLNMGTSPSGPNFSLGYRGPQYG